MPVAARLKNIKYWRLCGLVIYHKQIISLNLFRLATCYQKFTHKAKTMDVHNAESNTPLHLAFLKKDTELVDMLLALIEKSSNSENVKNKYGLSTLHIACTRNNTQVIKNLLNSNADIRDSVGNKSPMWKGFTALHFAAEYKSLEAMKILVPASSKSDREKKNGNGQTALQIINKKLENLLVMSDLLSLDTDSNSYKNLSNFHVACARDDAKLVKKFLDNGASIDTPVIKDNNICSEYAPIHFAVESKNQENVKILVKKGADLSRKNFDGMTPLHLALCTEKNGERSPLVDALYKATRNKEANPKDNYDLSYLHVACTRNDVVLVKQLLEKNVDVNSMVTYADMKFYHYTPLHFATLYENVEMVRLLIDQGANVNACDGAHYGTPLLMAFFFGNKMLIDMLLASGADPKAVRPSDKETTLSCLIYGIVDRKDRELLQYIEKLVMECQLDVNARDHEGDTPLHSACTELSNASPCIELLLEFGADINVENDKGETAFTCAMDENYNQYFNNAADYMMLYRHVQKLKALGLVINEKNERCCEQLMMKRDVWKIEELSDDRLAVLEQERMEEIQRMIKLELAQDLSLFDLIMLEPERFVSGNVALVNYNTVAAVAKEFPIYGYLFRLRMQKIEMIARNTEAVDRPGKRLCGEE